MRLLVFLIPVHSLKCLCLKASVLTLRWAFDSKKEQKRLYHLKKAKSGSLSGPCLELIVI